MTNWLTNWTPGAYERSFGTRSTMSTMVRYLRWFYPWRTLGDQLARLGIYRSPYRDGAET